MKRLLLAAITVLGMSCALVQPVLGQLNQNVVTLIPSTDSSGAPLAAGELHFRDLTNPASATPHYSGFKSNPSQTANHVYQMPNGGTGCWSSDSSDVLTLSPCPTGDDSLFSLFNHSDNTKLLKFSLAGVTTATTRTWTVPNANITVAGTNIAQTWLNTQTCDSSTGAINMGSLLVFRCSDRTLWNLGDFEGHITMSADNTWNMGSAAKRVKELFTPLISMPDAASSTTGCTVSGVGTGNGISCNNSVDLKQCLFGSHGVSCNDSSIPTLTITTDGAGTFQGAVQVGSLTIVNTGGGGTRGICVDNSGQVIVSGCPGGTVVPSGTYTFTGGNTFSTLTTTFSADLNCGSSANIDMAGTLVFRCSDRTLWNLGDFEGHITMSADNTWNVGSAAKRVKELFTPLISMPDAASSTTGCTISGVGTGNGINCNNSSDLKQCLFGSHGVSCNDSSIPTLTITTDGAGTFGSSVTAQSFIVNGGSVNISNAIVAASSGKKHAGGSSSLSSGVKTVSTGLSSVDYFMAIPVTGGPTCGVFTAAGCELLTTASPSGGSVTVYSSNTSSSAFFFWEAVGAP